MNWAARIQEILRRYRRTFRVKAPVMDRILTMKAERVASYDIATGKPAPTQAWFNYSVVASFRSFQRERNAGVPNGDRSAAENFVVYPNNSNGPNGYGKLDSTTGPTPAEVRVVDADQGVIDLALVPGLNDIFDTALPGLMEVEGVGTGGDGYPIWAGPTNDITKRGRPICFDALSAIHKPVQLSSGHKVALILSVVPAAPNDKRQFHRIIVKPSDPALRRVLPAAAQRGLDRAGGPPKEIFIEREFARVAWQDERAQDIYKILGLIDGKPNLTGLLINAGGQSLIKTKNASIDEVALAAAAAYYAREADRFEGSMEGEFTPLARPVGSIAELTHALKNGEMVTRLLLSETSDEVDLSNYLNPSTRKILYKANAPGEGAR